MNETTIEVLRGRLESLQVDLRYQLGEAKDYRRLVKEHAAKAKGIKRKIADIKEVLDAAANGE
jgi:hypothetical protein